MKTHWKTHKWAIIGGALVACVITTFGCTPAHAQSGWEYQTRQETTRVEVSPGRFESQWVPAEYGTALDAAGRPYTYIARPGYTRQVWVEPVYEYRTQTVTVSAPCPPPVQTVVFASAYCPPVVQSVAYCPPPVPVVYCPPPRPVVYCPPPRPVVYCPPPAPRSSFSLSVNIGGSSGRGHGGPVHHVQRPSPAPVCVTPARPVRHSPQVHHRGNDRSAVSVSARVSVNSRSR